MKNDTEQGLYTPLVDKGLEMVIAQWKDLQILQTVSTFREAGISTVQRHIGLDMTEL